VGLGGVTQLYAARAMQPFGVAVHVTVFLKKVLEPAKDLIRFGNEGYFVPVHEVEGI
jgi:hypothetical protein